MTNSAGVGARQWRVCRIGPVAREAAAQVLGRVPKPLPQGQSFYGVTGPVNVNGKPATRDNRIGPNDTVDTGKGA